MSLNEEARGAEPSTRSVLTAHRQTGTISGHNGPGVECACGVRVYADPLEGSGPLDETTEAGARAGAAHARHQTYALAEAGLLGQPVAGLITAAQAEGLKALFAEALEVGRAGTAGDYAASGLLATAIQTLGIKVDAPSLHSLVAEARQA